MTADGLGSAYRNGEPSASSANLTYEREMRARTAARGSVPFQIVMAAAFFLPSVRSCSRIETPLEYASGSWPMAIGVVPPYVLAAFFAFGTAFAWMRRQAPNRTLLASSRIALAVTLGSMLALIAAGSLHASVLGGCLLGAGLTLLFVIWLGTKPLGDGWIAWRTRLLSFSLLSTPHVLMMGIAVFADVHERTTQSQSGIGARAFVISWLAQVGLIFRSFLVPAAPRR